MVNFRQPYLSAGFRILERWHISLSTWLRYLYIPLGEAPAAMENLAKSSDHDGDRRFGMEPLDITSFSARSRRGVIGEHTLFLRRTGSGKRCRMDFSPSGFVCIVTFNVCLTLLFFEQLRSRLRCNCSADCLTCLAQRVSGRAFTMLAMFSLPLFLVDLMEQSGGDHLDRTPTLSARHCCRRACAVDTLTGVFSTFHFQFKSYAMTREGAVRDLLPQFCYQHGSPVTYFERRSVTYRRVFEQISDAATARPAETVNRLGGDDRQLLFLDGVRWALDVTSDNMNVYRKFSKGPGITTIYAAPHFP